MGASDGILMLAQKQKQSQKNRFFKIRWGGGTIYELSNRLLCRNQLDLLDHFRYHLSQFQKVSAERDFGKNRSAVHDFLGDGGMCSGYRGRCFPRLCLCGQQSLADHRKSLLSRRTGAGGVFLAEFAQKRAWFVPKWTILHRVLRLGPLVLFLVCAVMTPVSELLFTIDADGIYHRGPGWVLHTGTLVYYLVYATVAVLYQCSLEPLQFKRRQYYPLLLFFLAPTTAGVLQVLIYGLSCFQAGVTIGIVMICMANQNYVMSTDALTGVYNRQALGNLLHDLYKQTGGCRLDVFMVDINDFKIINDKHGHMVGDQLLKQTASILDEICHELVDKPFLCRYGGDEFLMLLRNSSENAAQLNAKLKDRFEEEIKKEDRMYMTVSIGCAEGICNDEAEFERLLKEADADMYTDKSAYKDRKTVS